MVELRTLTGENLLNADPRYWSEPYPPADLGTPFAPWNGHTYWVGPQSEWWTQQDLDPARRKARAIWPPDPFHETARYSVRERSQTRVSLESPPSPISGLVRRLDVEIVAPRVVRLRVTATNVRSKPVAWDLWSNTRVRPEGWAYVRLAEGGIRKVDGPADGSPAYPHLLRRGFLVSPPGEKAVPPQTTRTSKAFLRPASGEVDYFRGHDLLRKRTEGTSERRLHPEQALVEIYRAAGREPADDLLELEMHGPYETLAPGAAMSFEETWELVTTPGRRSPSLTWISSRPSRESVRGRRGSYPTGSLAGWVRRIISFCQIFRDRPVVRSSTSFTAASATSSSKSWM